MKTFYFSLSIILLLAIGCSSPKLYKSKLASAWPEKTLDQSYYFVGNGVVHLKSGKNVTGLIKLFSLYDGDHKLDTIYTPVEVLPAGKTKKEDIQTIYLKEIFDIELQRGTSRDSDEFKPFDSSSLGILIGEKYNYQLYCSHWIDDTYSSSSPDSYTFIYWAEILLTKNGNVIDRFSTYTRSSQRWLDYVKFINKRYNLNLSKYFFRGKNEKIMIDYILEKENEHQDSKPIASVLGKN